MARKAYPTATTTPPTDVEKKGRVAATTTTTTTPQPKPVEISVRSIRSRSTIAKAMLRLEMSPCVTCDAARCTCPPTRALPTAGACESKPTKKRKHAVDILKQQTTGKKKRSKERTAATGQKRNLKARDSPGAMRSAPPRNRFTTPACVPNTIQSALAQSIGARLEVFGFSKA